MKSYVALGFGNNFFYALGEDALPIPPNLLKEKGSEDENDNDDNKAISSSNPPVNLIPLHAETSVSTCQNASNLQEWFQSNSSGSYASTTRPIVACGTTHTTIVLPEPSSSNTNTNNKSVVSGGQANLLGTLFGHVHTRPTPQPTRLPVKIIRLASGRRHVLALTEGCSPTSSNKSGGGVLLSWGAGHFGQLGHGPELTSSLEPRIVERLLPQKCGGSIVDIAAGGLHSLAVIAVENGHQKTIGENNTVVVRETRLFAWGSNRKSQCGVEGGKCATVPSPMPVVVIKREGRKSGGAEEKVDKVVHFEKIEAGRLHSVGLTAYGEGE